MHRTATLAATIAITLATTAPNARAEPPNNDHHTNAPLPDVHGPRDGHFSLTTRTAPGPDSIAAACTWTIAARERVIPADPARVRFALALNNRDTAYSINADRDHLRGERIHAELVLTRTDTDQPTTRRVRLQHHHFGNERHGRKHHRGHLPRAGHSTRHTVLNVDTDLRRLFGPLEPGLYNIRLELPGFFLTPKDAETAPPPSDVSSPAITIEVADIDEHTALANTRPGDHEFLFAVPAPPPTDDEAPNHFAPHHAVVAFPGIADHPDATLSFPIDTAFQTDPAWGTAQRPARALADFERLASDGTWQYPDDHPFGYCGTGVVSHTLRAGEHAHITLRPPPTTPGIYRYVVNAELVTHPRQPDPAGTTEPREARFVSLPLIAE